MNGGGGEGLNCSKGDLPVKSFSDSLGTWSLSVYLSVKLRDKPGVILISSLSPSPSPGPG